MKVLSRGDGGTGDRGYGAWQHDLRLNPWRNCSAPRVLRLPAKYLEEGTQLLIPAKLKPGQVKKIQALALKVSRAGMSGMARVDFFVEKKGGKIFLNEVNTIPGFTRSACIQDVGSERIPFRND